MRIDRYYLDEWEVHIEERQFLAGLRRIYWFFTFLLFGTLQFKSIIIGDYNIFGTYTILLIIVVLLEWQAPFLPSPRTSIALSAILSFMITLTFYYEEFRIDSENNLNYQSEVAIELLIALFVLARIALVLISDDFLNQRKRSVIPKTQPAKERLEAYYGAIDRKEEDVKASIQSTKGDIIYLLLGSIPIVLSLLLAILAAFAINTIEIWKESAQPLSYRPIFLLLLITGFVMFVFTQRKIAKYSTSNNSK